MLRRSAERTMQAMVAAVFSRLRVLPASAEVDPSSLTLNPSLSSSVSLADSMTPVDVDGGLRMLPPDPRGAHIPAAGEAEGVAHDDEALDEGELGDGALVVFSRPFRFPLLRCTNPPLPLGTNRRASPDPLLPTFNSRTPPRPHLPAKPSRPTAHR